MFSGACECASECCNRWGLWMRLISSATHIADATELISFAPVGPCVGICESLTECKQNNRIIERTGHIPARVELVRRLVIEILEIALLDRETCGGAAGTQ